MQIELTTEARQGVTQKLAGLLSDPVRFARGVLRHDVWGTQAAILRAIQRHPRVAVKACHASGKTFTAAEAVLWWTRRYADGIVVTTAPTWTQVERLLWGEIHRAANQSPLFRYLCGGKVPLNRTELRFAELNYAMGLSTNEGVRFQGFHGHVLIVLDEAPGVLPEIWEAIEGIRAGGDVHLLALGNPTVSSGPFFDAFTSHRDNWQTFTIGAFDTPNLAGMSLEQLLELTDEALDENTRPYLTTRRWVKEKYQEWGPRHPLWEARVLGQFPIQGEDALISLAWVEAAARRTAQPFPSDTLSAGIDVAGPGEDETALIVRHGNQIVHRNQWTQADPRGAVVADLKRFDMQKLDVNVDAIGIGYNFGLHLRDQGFKVRLVNVGESAFDKEKYANRKAELYWGLRSRFQQGDIAGTDDERLMSQLTGIRYRHNARGQVVIESKDEARKRGVKSPDRAESLMLAFVPPVQGGVVSMGGL